MSSAFLEMIRSIASRSFCSKAMFVMMAGNQALRLEGLFGKAAAAALSLALHRLAFLASGDAVSVAFEDFLGNPSDDGCRVLCALELLHKLRFKVFDVAH